MKRKIDETEYKILKHLSEHTDEYVASIYLSNLVGVSKKTITKYIDILNKELKNRGAIIEARTYNGYRLIIHDQKQFGEYLKQLSKINYQISDNICDINLMIRYFLTNDIVKTEDFENLLFVSRTTVMKNIKDVIKILDRFNISIQKKSHQGSTLVGSEHDIRCCINYELFFYERCSRDIYESKYEEYIDYEMYKKIEKAIIEVQEYFDIHTLNDSKLINLATSLYIGHVRNNMNHNLYYDEDMIDRFAKRNSYYFSQALISKLKAEFNLNLNDFDALFVTIYMVANRHFLKKEDVPVEEDYFNCQKLAIELVNYLHEINHFDYFNTNRQLIEDISLNLTALMMQSEFHLYSLIDVNLDKPSLEADLLSVQSAYWLEENFNVRLTRDQIYYLSMVIYPIFGRYNFKTAKNKALVVSDFNKFVGKGMKERLLRNFGTYISSVEVLNRYELEHYDYSDVSYLFSSYELNQLPTIPSHIKYFNVNIFFDEIDKSYIRNSLFSNSVNGSNNYLLFLDSSNYFKINHVKTKEGAIQYIAETIGETNQQQKEYIKQINLYESYSEFSVVNNVIFITPLFSVSKMPMIKIFMMDKPIKWNNQRIQLIILWDRGNEKGNGKMFENESLPHIFYGLFSQNEVVKKLREGCAIQEIEDFIVETNRNILETGSSFR
ncbi:MAG: BglG family transcription antiterminator [Traorella sp.]